MNTNILCVCAGNTCRSLILERLLRKKVLDEGLDVRVESAGLHKSARRGKRAGWRTRACMRRRHIDVCDHRSQHIDAFDVSVFDLVVVMEPGMQVEIERRGYQGRLLVLDILNPSVATLEAYEFCVMQLERGMEKIAGAL